MAALLDELEREPRRPGRRFGIGALALASLGAGAFAAVQLGRDPEPPPPPCTDLDHHLTGVWDEGRRTSLEDHFGGLGLDGREAWSGVEPRLDAYAAAWVEARTQNCRATEVQAEQSTGLRDARNACLDRRKVELDALIGALAHVDAVRVHEAVAAASKLPSLAICASEEALRQDPQPTDPALAQEAGELERQLAEVEALQKVGEHKRALELARPLAEATRALGFGPLTAKVLRELGYAEDRSGTLESAEQALQEAYLLALEHRLTALAADTAADLVWVVGSRRDEHEEGRRWSQVARAHFLANGEANEIPGLMINHGALELAAGRDEVARAVFEEGIALIEALPDAERDEIELATLHNNLGIALSNLGEQDAAVDAWTRGLEVRGRVLGEHHPHVAISYDNLAGAAFDRGDWSEAIDLATRSIDIWTASVGHAQGEADSARDTLVYASIALSDVPSAIRHARAALESVLGRSDATDDDRSWARERLGYALMAAGDWEGARDEFARSLELLDATDEDVPFSYQAHTLAGLGRSLLELDELDEATKHLALVVEAGPDAGLDDVVAFSARFDHARAQWPSAAKKPRSMIRTDLERLREEMRHADPPARLRLRELEAWLEAH